MASILIARCLIGLVLYSDTRKLKDLPGTVPILSDIEEARALQYKCECIESFLIDQGM